MSVTPPRQGGPPDPSSQADPNAAPAPAKWGTVTGGMRSPPPAPSSGAGVRRNHTIHGARQHGKPRLEKHFEQPEDASVSAQGSTDAAASGHSAPQSTRFNDDEPLNGLQASPSSSREASLVHSSSFSATAGNAAEFVPSLTPLQALYSKSSISRNLSLPTRHTNKLTANLPQSATQGRATQFNSLSAITGGSDLDDHDWEKLISSSDALGDEHHQDPHASNSLSLRTDQPWSSTLFSTGQLGAPASSSHPTSPITASGPFSDANHHNGSVGGVDLFGDTQALGGSASFLRRHQSLNHHAGRSAGHRLAARSSDLRSRYAGDAADPAMPSYPSQTDAAFSPVRHATSFSATNSPVMPTSYSKAPWNQTPQEPIGSPSRFAGSFPSQSHDVPHNRLPSGFDGSASLAGISQNLSHLDISGSSALAAGDDQDSITPTQHSLFGNSAAQSSSSGGGGGADGQPLGGRRLPQLVTSRDALQRGQRVNGTPGPMSAAAFVPPIGHAHSRHQSNDPFASEAFDVEPSHRFGPFTAAPTGGWQDKDSIAGRFGDAAPGGPAWPQQPPSTMGIDPNLMALSMALAQEQKRNAMLQAQLGARSNQAGSPDPPFFGMQPMDLNGPMQSIGQQLRAGALPSSPPMGGIGNLPSRGQPFPMQQSAPSFRPPSMHAASPPSGPAPGPSADGNEAIPVDATSLALQKGYNPPPGAFGPPPPTARFFVIKSYTEDDVHKSLKYEIWASTDKGNQRLDKAFRETASTGPIYLFYSVNASGHFCGMAQMLTPLDYATSSNVWAQDGKWKGTFKVRWIYVKDLPNGQLRHIRLTNTPECKPVTQSRDTQELTPEAGREVWRIMSEYGAKTSLLQDFNFYEMQGRPGAPVQQQVGSPALGLPRNSPKPHHSPGLAFPASPNARSASPNGARRAHQGGTPQRPHGVSGLGLATGTPRSGGRQINELSGEAGRAGDTAAAQSAGLAPSAI